MKMGVGYRRELGGWIDQSPPGLECLELTAEHFFGGGLDRVTELAGRYPLCVHGLGLSLGTPGPLDAGRLEAFARVVAAARPMWVSEHIAFTRAAGLDLGHLNPVPPTRAMARVVAGHARELADRCCRPVILENITAHLRLEGDLSEPEFLNEICSQADCGLLLDVTNVFVNSRNHGFDPIRWLDALDLSRVVQMHLVGYSRNGDRFADSHSEPIQSELLDLAAVVLRRAPVRAVVLERDEAFEPGVDGGVARELLKLHGLAVPA